ncbi:MAG: hypothetical protein ACREMQ_16340 [Longimicrobiales bacterium]
MRGRKTDRGVRPLTRAMACACRVATLALLAACDIDFVEPDLPERGAPAVFEATLRTNDGATVDLQARLAPGLDESGLRRGLLRASVRLLGTDVLADSVLRNGTRVYRAALPLGPATRPITLEAPQVEDVTAMIPVVRWSEIMRQGSDTVEVARGSDLVLMVDTTRAAVQPAPAIRQWVLLLRGDGDEFLTIGSNGTPPDSIVVPARFIPASASGFLTARLVHQQLMTFRPAPGDYIALVTLDASIAWTVRVRGAAAVGARAFTND